MRSFFSVCFFFVCLASFTLGVSSTSFAKEPPEPKTKSTGGFVCFSIEVAPTPTNTPATLSCQTLCVRQGAACTGVTSFINPSPTCESPAPIGSCRCCKVEGLK